MKSRSCQNIQEKDGHSGTLQVPSEVRSAKRTALVELTAPRQRSSVLVEPRRVRGPGVAKHRVETNKANEKGSQVAVFIVFVCFAFASLEAKQAKGYFLVQFRLAKTGVNTRKTRLFHPSACPVRSLRQPPPHRSPRDRPVTVACFGPRPFTSAIDPLRKEAKKLPRPLTRSEGRCATNSITHPKNTPQSHTKNTPQPVLIQDTSVGFTPQIFHQMPRRLRRAATLSAPGK